MFHKEDSSVSIRSSKKAKDVPLRKSDRKQVRQRVGNYFGLRQQDEPTTTTTTTTSSTLKLERVLDSIFLQPLLTRTIPLPQKTWNMVLYLCKPESNNHNHNNDHDHDDDDSSSAFYHSSTQVVWMSMEEKNKVVQETPSVALWAILCNICPEIVSLHTIYVPFQVSKYICRGADLMRAGMLNYPPFLASAFDTNNKHNHKKETKRTVAIAVRGNPQPFAVGWLKITPNDPIGVDTKGVGVDIWNCYGDDIWKQSNTKEQQKGITLNAFGGASYDNGHYGNVGFIDGKYVVPLVTQDSEDVDVDVDVDDDVDDEHEPETGTQQAETIGNGSDSAVNDSTNTATTSDGNALVATESSTEDVPTNKDATRDEETVAPLSPEERFHQAVCQALVSLNNKDFPILANKFYTQHVKPSTDVDLSATSYKKFGNYLKEQVRNGFLEVGPDPNNKKNTDRMACLLRYDKKHDDLRGLTKQTLHSSALSSTSSSSPKLVLVNLYMIPNHWTKLMRLNQEDVKATNATSEERKGTGMLTTPEVRKILESYLAREELIPKGRGDQVVLDGPLTDILYNKKQQQGKNLPKSVLRKDVVKEFTASCNKAYALVQMPGSRIVELKRGTPPMVEIEVSMRQSKKFVTRLRGLEDYQIDPHYFSKDVTKRLACSGTIETATSLTKGRPALKKKNYVELVFQGNIVHELEALLIGDESLSSHGGVKQSEYSIPSKVLDVTLRKGVPGRNRKGGGGGKRK